MPAQKHVPSVANMKTLLQLHKTLNPVLESSSSACWQCGLNQVWWWQWQCGFKPSLMVDTCRKKNKEKLRKSHMCSLMGIVLSQNLQYADIPFWNDSWTPLPKHHWDLQIIAVWNIQARLNLNNCNPERLNHLAQSNPEAKWNTTRVSNDAHIRMPPLGTLPPGLNKLKRLKPGHLLVAKHHNLDTSWSLHPGQTITTQILDKSSPHLA